MFRQPESEELFEAGQGKQSWGCYDFHILGKGVYPE